MQQSVCVGDVVCWEKPRLQITHRHRPRAKVGGCGVSQAAAALISAGVHRRSFVPAALPLPDIRRVTLISFLARRGRKGEKLMQSNPRVTWYRPAVLFEISLEALLLSEEN